MRSIYLPSITYPFPSSYIEKEDLEDTQRHTTTKFLLLNHPSSIVYASEDYGGLGFPHLPTEQGILQITELIKQTNSDTTTGKLYQIVIDTYQLIAGTLQPIFESKYQLKYVDGAPLITNIGEYLIQQNASIKLTKAWTPTTQRVKDNAIMGILCKQNLPEWELYEYNKCRLYLQVTMLSEITEPKVGTVITIVINLRQLDFQR